MRARTMAAAVLVAFGAVGCGAEWTPAPTVAPTVIVISTSGYPAAVRRGAGVGERGGEACGGELLVNGGFESPAISGDGWGVFTSVEGWRTSFGPGLEIQRHVSGRPHTGEQHAELDSHASSGIYQDVPTEGGDTLYEIRFALSARPGTSREDNHLRVLWNGTPVADLIAEVENPAWRVYRVRARGREGTSRLELQDAGISNSVGTYVNSVSVTRVCEGG